ncbi:MAG: 4'-phosphopantetheinyl transferase superfamily protein [Flavobacteriales bacterium]|nr:4'-phosphopantetheinyl transferase superfamily protein [Flavobacteriales bacterium]
MPIYKTISSEGQTTIYIWKIEESFEELSEGLVLTDNSMRRLSGMKSELHQKGFLSVRRLLKHAGYEDSNLYYNDFGRPFLNDDKHISITHSFEFAAVLISEQEAGVDIEKNREKIVNIQHRFVNTEVDSLSDEDLVKQLTVIWGAKESMYKTYPYGGLSFHDHIGINPFLFADGRSSGRVIFENWKREYEIKFEFLKEGFTLVHALVKP